ncbi:MAG: hypothetical protein U0401_18565 [Anaerolineae bacterium]
MPDPITVEILRNALNSIALEMNVIWPAAPFRRLRDEGFSDGPVQ